MHAAFYAQVIYHHYTTLIVSTMIVCVCNPDFVETYLLLLKVKHAVDSQWPSR